jgi:hypothetical protein
MTSSTGLELPGVAHAGSLATFILMSARYHTDRKRCAAAPKRRGKQDRGRVLHEASGSLGAPGLATAWLHQTSSPRSAAGRAWLPPEPPATSSSCGAALTQASNCVVPAAPSTCSVWVPVGLVRPLAGELNSDYMRPFQVLGLASSSRTALPPSPALCAVPQAPTARQLPQRMKLRRSLYAPPEIDVLPTVVRRKDRSPNAKMTSVCAGHRLGGAPRRNRTGDPILTMEPPGTAVRTGVSPGHARP